MSLYGGHGIMSKAEERIATGGAPMGRLDPLELLPFPGCDMPEPVNGFMLCHETDITRDGRTAGGLYMPPSQGSDTYRLPEQMLKPYAIGPGCPKWATRALNTEGIFVVPGTAADSAGIGGGWKWVHHEAVTGVVYEQREQAETEGGEDGGEGTEGAGEEA